MNDTVPSRSVKSSTRKREPKRHHWWPQLQSGHWTASDGLVYAVRRDGSYFRAPPSKIGVEGELYTRFELTGEKDLTIEKWFSREVETPFVAALGAIIAANDITSRPIPARDRKTEQELKDLGFIAPQSVEILNLSKKHRSAIDAYLAALLVRNPIYLAKLVRFHDQHGTPLPPELSRGEAIKTVALDNMLSVYELYRDHISRAHLGLLIADCTNEFIFSDAGIIAQEPWRPGPIPFDIHAPLTPKLALEVLPVPDPSPRACYIMRVNNRGVSRFNRIALADAQNFVFAKGAPPIGFIKKHFGNPAPKSIGYRWTGNDLETTFDRSRDR